MHSPSSDDPTAGMRLRIKNNSLSETYFSGDFYGMPVDTLAATPMDAPEDDMETGVVLHSRRASRDLTLDSEYVAQSPVDVPFHTRSISHSSSFQTGDISFIQSPVDEDATNSIYSPQVVEQSYSPVTPNLRVAYEVEPSKLFSPLSTEVEPPKQPKRTRSQPKHAPPTESYQVAQLEARHRLDSGHRQTKRPSDFDESSASASPNRPSDKGPNPFEEYNQSRSNSGEFQMLGLVEMDPMDDEPSSEESSVHSEPDSSDLDRLGTTSDINILYASDNDQQYDGDLSTMYQERRRAALANAKSSKKLELDDDDEDVENEQNKPTSTNRGSRMAFGDNDSVPFLGRIASIDENIAATPAGNGQTEPTYQTSKSNAKDVRLVPSPYMVQTNDSTNEAKDAELDRMYTMDVLTTSPTSTLPTDMDVLDQYGGLTLSMQLIQRSEGKSLSKTPNESNSNSSESRRRTPPEKYVIVDSDNDDEANIPQEKDSTSQSGTVSVSLWKHHRPDALSVDSTNLDSAFSAFDSRTNATRAGIITITPQDPNMPSGVSAGSQTSGSETLIHRSPREEGPPNIEAKSNPPPFPGIRIPLPAIPQGTSQNRYNGPGGASPQPPVVERRASAGPLRRAATMSNLRIRQTPAKRKSGGSGGSKKAKHSPETHRPPLSAHTPTYRPKSASSSPKFPTGGRVRRAKSSISIPKGLKILNPDHRERMDALERNLRYGKEKIKRLERENRKYRDFCRDMGFNPDALPQSPIHISQVVSKYDHHAKMEADITPASIVGMSAASVTTDDATPQHLFNLRHVKANKSLSTSASNSKSSFIGRNSGGMYDDIQSSLISTVTTQDDWFGESRRLKDQIQQLRKDLDQSKQHIVSYETQLGNLHDQLTSTRQANMVLISEREQDSDKLQQAAQEKLKWEVLFDKARESKSQLAESASMHIGSLRAKLLAYQNRFGALDLE